MGSKAMAVPRPRPLSTRITQHSYCRSDVRISLKSLPRGEPLSSTRQLGFQEGRQPIRMVAAATAKREEGGKSAQSGWNIPAHARFFPFDVSPSPAMRTKWMMEGW